MAAISITSSNVALVSGEPRHGQLSGGAFNAGQVVYLSDSGTWLKAQGDGTAVEAGANGLGVALSSSDASGAYCSIATSGCIVSYGAILTAGIVYIVGDTAGSIYPSADAGSTDKVTILGLAISTSQLLIQRVYNAGAVIA